MNHNNIFNYKCLTHRMSSGQFMVEITYKFNKKNVTTIQSCLMGPRLPALPLMATNGAVLAQQT